jgi:hypothetical protein
MSQQTKWTRHSKQNGHQATRISFMEEKTDTYYRAEESIRYLPSWSREGCCSSTEDFRSRLLLVGKLAAEHQRRRRPQICARWCLIRGGRAGWGRDRRCAGGGSLHRGRGAPRRQVPAEGPRPARALSEGLALEPHAPL